MDKLYFVDLTSKLYRLTFFFPQKEPLRDKIRETGDEILADVVVILEGEIEEKKKAAFKVEKNIKILDVLLELAKLQNWIEEDKIGVVQNNYLEIKREVEELNDITKRRMKMLEPKTFLSEKETSQSSNNTRYSDNSICHSRPAPFGAGLNSGGDPFTEEIDSRLRGNDKEESQPKTTDNSSLRAEQSEARQSQKTTSEKIDINERQQKIIKILEENGKMQVQDFQPFFPNVTKRTLRRYFSFLTDKNLIKRTGKANQTFYQKR
jgi:glucan-binding YG repeat protein